MFARFFKCSFVLRVGAVIFELNESNMSNFVKFEFLTLKTERVFEEKQLNFVSKTGRKGNEFINQKAPQPMQNFLNGEKIHF